MTKIKRLTDEERSALESGMCRGSHTALRIIDAQAAVIERVRQCPRHSVAGTLYVAWVDLDAALAAAPEHTAPAASYGAAETVVELRRLVDIWASKFAAANARVAELEAQFAAGLKRWDEDMAAANARADAAAREAAEWKAAFAQLQSRRAAPEHTAPEFTYPPRFAGFTRDELLQRDLNNANARVAELERLVTTRENRIEVMRLELDAATARADSAERAHEQALNERDLAHQQIELENAQGLYREVERLRAVNKELLSTRHGAELERDAANARADAAKEDAAMWNRQAAEQKARADAAETDLQITVNQRDRAESEAATLRMAAQHKTNLLDMRARETEQLRAELERVRLVSDAHVKDNIKAGDEVDAANARVAELEQAYRECVAHKNDAIARADAAERDSLTEASEVIRLEDEANKWRVSAENGWASYKRSEAEAAALRAEVAKLWAGNEFLSQELGRSQADADRERCERVQLEEHESEEVAALRAEVEAKCVVICERNDEVANLRSRLSTATELVLRWSNFDFDCPEEEYDEETDTYAEDGSALKKLCDDTQAFLSTAPTEREAAERKVMEACAGIEFSRWEGATGCTSESFQRVLEAELARREVKP